MHQNKQVSNSSNAQQCSPDDAPNAVVELLDVAKELEQTPELLHLPAPLLRHSLRAPLPDQSGQAIQRLPQRAPAAGPVAVVQLVMIAAATAAVPVELIAEHVLLARGDEAFEQERLAGLERAQSPAARLLAEERGDAGLGVERAELVAERARRAEPRAGGGEAGDLRGERRVRARLRLRLRLLLLVGRRRGLFALEERRRGGDAPRGARGRRRGRGRERGEEAAAPAAASLRGARGEERRCVEAWAEEVRGRRRGRGLRASGHDVGLLVMVGRERAGRRVEP